MKTIGFIGAGNMARPIIRSTAEKGVFEKNDIYVYDPNTEALNSFCACVGVNAVGEGFVRKNCDVIMLCTKPQVFPTILPAVGETVRDRDPLIVSIAAGKTTEYIASLLGYDAKIARIFPNLNAEVGSAISAYTSNQRVSEDEINLVGKICSSYGEAVRLAEDKFSVFGVLGGCAPAYSFMFIDALAKSGEKYGLDKETAFKAAVQVVLGSTELLKAGVGEPGEMVKRVCSPGGTTIEGVNVLDSDGLYALVDKAFKASYDRDKQL